MLARGLAPYSTSGGQVLQAVLGGLARREDDVDDVLLDLLVDVHLLDDLARVEQLRRSDARPRRCSGSGCVIRSMIFRSSSRDG